MTVTPDARHLTASMVVLDPVAGTVLLIHHKATGKLMFPGGHVDPDETPFEAASREVTEETGLFWIKAFRTEPLLQLPGMDQEPAPWLVYEIPAPAKPDRGPGKPTEPPHWHIDELFVATSDSAMPLRPQLAEVESASWVSVADLLRHGRSVYDYRAEVPEVAAMALRLVRGEETTRRVAGSIGALNLGGTITVGGDAIGSANNGRGR